MTASAVIFGCEGPALSPDEAAFFREADPWGFIIFARNVESPEQLRALTADMREAVGRDAPVLVDQEGGRVARLRPPHWTRFPAAASDHSAEMVELRHLIIAAELREAGIDVNCAPILDLPQPGMTDAIGDRAMARDVETLIAYGAAARRGMTRGGVLPVVKHMPGHGRAEVDSHDALPFVSAPRLALEADMAPFRAHADAPMGMTCHLVFEAVDAARPATFSPDVIRLIREEIGFGGLLMTDDISMGALDGDPPSRARRALAAGCDMVLHCNGDFAEMQAMAAEIPQLDEAGARRAAVVDALPRDAETVNLAEARARYEALSRETAHA